MKIGFAYSRSDTNDHSSAFLHVTVRSIHVGWGNLKEAMMYIGSTGMITPSFLPATFDQFLSILTALGMGQICVSQKVK